MKFFTTTILLALFGLAQPQCVLRTVASKTFNGCTYKTIHNPLKFPISIASNSYRDVTIRFQSSFIPTYRADIMTIPTSHKLISLTITRSKLHTIESGVLGGYAYLETASFDQNNISRLPNNTFKSKTLRYLNVSYNNIIAIESGAFGNVSLLLDLDLSHNNISEVKSLYFKDTHFLRSLNLSSNSIRKLDSLVTLSNLLELNLGGNFLKDINGLPASLEILDVSNNDLTKLKHSMFSQTNLKYLDVSSNGIKEIDWSVLRDLSLNTLRINDNKIEYFNGTLRTKNIAIGGNIFNCDKLIGLLQMYKIHDVAVESGGDVEKVNVHGIACSVGKEENSEEFEDEEERKNATTSAVEIFSKVSEVETVTKVPNEQDGSRIEENQLNEIQMTTTSCNIDTGEQIISKSEKIDREVLNEIKWKISANLYAIYALLGLTVLVNAAYFSAYYFGYQVRYFGRNNQSSSKELVAIM